VAPPGVYHCSTASWPIKGKPFPLFYLNLAAVQNWRQHTPAAK